MTMDSNSSQSLFSSSTSQSDVRHDLDTVQKRWSKEQKRRRKYGFVIFGIVLVLAILVYVAMAYYMWDVPGHSWFFPNEGQEQLPPEEPPSTKSPMGYPKAKMHIEVIPALINEQVLKALTDAVETKPSEIYLSYLTKDDVDQATEDALRKSESLGFRINGTTKTYYYNADGKRVDIDFDKRPAAGLTFPILKEIIARFHEEAYGKSPNYPLFPKSELPERLSPNGPFTVKETPADAPKELPKELFNDVQDIK